MLGIHAMVWHDGFQNINKVTMMDWVAEAAEDT